MPINRERFFCQAGRGDPAQKPVSLGAAWDKELCAEPLSAAPNVGLVIWAKAATATAQEPSMANRAGGGISLPPQSRIKVAKPPTACGLARSPGGGALPYGTTFD